jgi:nitroreductase/molybdopterin/thiamine biosynthesis adenylyltransferase
MTDLFEALSGASAPDRDSHRPAFFRLALPDDRVRLDELLKREPRVVVHDALHSQLTELVRSLNPSVKYTKDELDAAATAHLKGTPAAEYGVWVYYPWSFRLVHLLDETEFSLVRTDRNRNKITREEQALLATKKVGVIGLSVGQSVSLTMALERSFGEIRLADFDTLELSNLNRIRSGVHEMGCSKVVNTAREIAELDPFLNVRVFEQGITRGNIDRFFSENGGLDVLIEECDSVDIKIIARQKAKQLGIPVIMDMSDRGCLDVERFDLEPDRPIMHGWIDHLDLEAAGRPMTNEEKIPFMLPIVGVETLSARLKASVIELGQTVGTWPQLATSVVLGGALAGDSYRRVLLDQFRGSGRWFIDLEELVQVDNRTGSNGSHPNTVPFVQDLRTIVEVASLKSADAIPISRDVALIILEAGALAPSAGNSQPWQFILHEERIIVVHDQVRSASRWDPDHLIAHIALGGCLENMTLRANELGYRVRTQLNPIAVEGQFYATFEFISESHKKEPEGLEYGLSSMIGKRCTNRKVVKREPIQQDVLMKIRSAALDIRGCYIGIFDTQKDLDELAEICGSAEKVRILDPEGHHDFFKSELRWTSAEAERTGDGLDLATLELSTGDAAALKIASDPKAIELVRAWQGGRALERFSTNGVKSASAVVIVHAKGSDLESRINGGRAAQRVWLQANLLGIGVHPISAPIFLFHALDHLDNIAVEHRIELERLQKRFDKVVGHKQYSPLFMMRLSLNGEPSVRSLRRPLHDMITVLDQP